MSVNEKMTAIADAIREKTGGTEQLTLDDMTTEIPKVYEAGYTDATYKRNVSGSAVVISDISPTEDILDIKVRSENGTDVSGVSLKKYGGNILPYSTLTNASGVSEANGIISINNASGASAKYCNTGFFTLPAGTYTFSIDTISVSGKYGLFIQKDVANDYSTPVPNITGVGVKTKTFTLEVATRVRLLFEITAGTTAQFKLQINVGNVAVPFEEYKEPITYTATADGIVEGVKPLYPTTTLMTDTEGVIIDCGYYGNLTSFEAGKVQATDEFWNNLQNYGKRTSYAKTFASWGGEYIRPKYKVVPMVASDTMQSSFQDCPRLKILESKYFDFSNLNTKPTTDYAGNYYTFSGCRNLERLEDIGLPPSYYYSTFMSCISLKTIDNFRSQEDTLYRNPFIYCYELENLRISGIIGQNGFAVQYSSKLSHDSLMSIINALKDYSTDTSGTTWLVTLGSANIAKLTADELQIITDKGWEYK